MTIVVDASVAMAWCLHDETSAYADAVLERLQRTEAFVPHLWGLQVANGLLVAERRGRLSASEAKRASAALLSLPIAVDPVSLPRAFAASFELARRHRLSSYDAAYLELALRTGGSLATLDQQLRAAAATEGVDSVDVGPAGG